MVEAPKLVQNLTEAIGDMEKFVNAYEDTKAHIYKEADKHLKNLDRQIEEATQLINEYKAVLEMLGHPYQPKEEGPETIKELSN